MATSAPQSSGKAWPALGCGVLGIIILPLVCSVLALVLGYAARREIAASGGRLTGDGPALAGIVLGWLGVVLTVVFAALAIGGVLS